MDGGVEKYNISIVVITIISIFTIIAIDVAVAIITVIIIVSVCCYFGSSPYCL